MIVVHWHKGARLSSYPEASANVRMVATQIKVLLKLLQRIAGLQLEDVHLIGHSLGAHVSGYAGTLLGDKIGRITGKFSPVSIIIQQEGVCQARYVSGIVSFGLTRKHILFESHPSPTPSPLFFFFFYIYISMLQQSAML